MTKAILKQDYDGFKKGQHVNIVGFFACSDGTRAVVTTDDSFTAIPMRDLKPDSYKSDY